LLLSVIESEDPIDVRRTSIPITVGRMPLLIPEHPFALPKRTNIFR